MIRCKVLFGFLCCLLFASVPCWAAQPNPALEKQIRQIIKEHPEIVLEALSKDKIGLFKLAAQGGEMLRKKRWRAQVRSRAKNPFHPVLGPERVMNGSPDAPFTVVEYTDFLCPACKIGYENSKELVKKYPDEFKVYLKHHPSEDLAEKISVYFEAIARQGRDKAWRFADQVFAGQGKIKKGQLAAIQAIVDGLKLDKARLARDLADPDIKSLIKADSAEAEKFRLFGTPGFLIQGVPIEGAAPVSLFLEVAELVKEVFKPAK